MELEKEANPDLDTGGKDTPEGEDSAKNHSIYIQPKSWARFTTVKQWSGLTWTELVDLSIGLIIAENLLPEEAVAELKKAGLFEKEDAVAVELAGLHGTGIPGKWASVSGTLEKIKVVLEEIDAELENVGQAIEDHAEAVILGPEAEPEPEQGPEKEQEPEGKPEQEGKES
jgi:hypothetical protein